jgi:hypothetical protein
MNPAGVAGATTTAEYLNINAITPDNSGLWSVSVNSSSQLLTPEPSNIILTLAGIVCLAILRSFHAPV